MQAAIGHRRRIVVAAVTALVLLASSCVTQDAVTSFASQSSQALAQGQPILKDIEDSCIRQHLVEQAVPDNVNEVFNAAAFQKAASDPACAAYASDQPGELAILKTLTDYFTAISELASTGTASAKGDAAGAKKSSAPPKVIDAVSQLATFLGKVAAGGYQAKHLSSDIKSTDESVATVVDALIEIVQKRYVENQLAAEERDITETYKDLLRRPGAEPRNGRTATRPMGATGDGHRRAKVGRRRLDRIHQGRPAVARRRPAEPAGRRLPGYRPRLRKIFIKFTVICSSIIPVRHYFRARAASVFTTISWLMGNMQPLLFTITTCRLGWRTSTTTRSTRRKSASASAAGHAKAQLSSAILCSHRRRFPGSASTKKDNLVAQPGEAPQYVRTPATQLGVMDFFPRPGKVSGAPLDLSPFAAELDFDRDFNGISKGNRIFRGAYAGEGTNPGWRLQAQIKPEN